MYKVEYLPIAQQDIADIATYIARNLSNPTAAEKLVSEMVSAASKLVDFPYIYPTFTPIKPLAHEFRKLIVKNYIMFYWVEEDKKVVTIARVIYARRDYERLLQLTK